jgi:hypothetical protein
MRTGERISDPQDAEGIDEWRWRGIQPAVVTVAKVAGVRTWLKGYQAGDDLAAGAPGLRFVAVIFVSNRIEGIVERLGIVNSLKGGRDID